MPLSPRYQDRDLVLEVSEGDALVVAWRGKSNDREPGRFLVPVFAQLLARAAEAKKPIVMDFSAVEYMNSSTFTPLVKLLDEAKRAGAGVVLQYDSQTKWQALSFSALRAFETPDGRIAVRAR